MNLSPLFNVLGLMALITLTACTFQPLNIQTRYITKENLASFQIGTPDPRLKNPAVGQRMLIQWNLSSAQFDGQNLFLSLRVRFRNRQEQTIKRMLFSRKGYATYDILNQNYFTSGGIVTYHAQIRNENSVLINWKHPLWVPFITLDTMKK